jgi:hypothetical protein
MRKYFLLLSAAGLLASCGQSNDGSATDQAKTAQPKKKAAYCFFKDAETKAWAATRGKDGNIVVKGKAYRSDPRYKALLNPATVTGTTAEITPTIAQNDGYAAPDNWWDVNATIPNSAAVDTVMVTCGPKTLAELKVAPKG